LDPVASGKVIAMTDPHSTPDASPAPDNDDEQSDEGGDSDVTPDPARNPEEGS